MVEASCSLSLSPETRESLLRVGVIRQNAFQRYDAPGVPLPGPINDAHAAASDFFQNLIIAYAPIGVTYVKFTEQIVKRFPLR
jgi:hypothetical protein